ncbi:MAG: caspase family protein [Opitutaceae bacterium]|nr:caspase family protein [Cephaloticoccus sp.]MCP5529333.1 caspase family protein [Opitutaceae bacterium]
MPLRRSCAFLLALLAVSLCAQTTPRLALRQGIPELPRTLDLNPAGRIVLMAEFGRIAFFAAETGELIREMRDPATRGAAFDHRGTVYVFTTDGVTVLNRRDLAVEKTLSIPDCGAFAFNADRTALVVAGQRLGKSSLWEIDTANQRARVKYTAANADPITHLSLAGDLALVRYASGAAELLKTGPRWASARIFPASAGLLGLMPDGRLLQAVTAGKQLQGLRFIDAVSGQDQTELALPPTYAPAPVAVLPARAGDPLFVLTPNTVTLIDPATATVRARLDPPGESYAGLAYDRATDRFWLHHRVNGGPDHGLNGIAIYRAADAIRLGRWTDNAYRVSEVWGHPLENRLLVRDTRGHFKSLTLEPGRIAIQSLDSPHLVRAAVSADGGRLALGLDGQSLGNGTGRDHLIQIRDPALTGAPVTLRLPAADGGTFHRLRQLAVSDDARFTLVGDNRQLAGLDADGRTLWTRPAVKSPTRVPPVLGARSGRVYLAAEPGAGPALTALDAASGRELWTAGQAFLWLVFNQKQDELLLIGAPEENQNAHGNGVYHRTELTWLDAATGRILRTATTTAFTPSTTLQPNADGQLLAALDGGRIRVVDTLSLLPLADLPFAAAYEPKVAFFGRNHYLAALADDGTIRLFDLLAQQPLARVQLLRDDRDWLVTDDSGRFDAPVPTQEKLRFAVNLSLVPLTAYFDAYFRPRLLDDLLLRRAVAPPALDFAALAAPPAARLTAVDTQQTVLTDDASVTQPDLVLNLAGAASPAAPILEFRIFQNGKRIATSTRGLVVEDDESADDEPSFNFNRQVPAQLLPGVNEFVAVAVNAQGIESAPARLTLRYATPPDQRTTLHLLAIGVNEYRNEKYNLNYAVPDARAFETELAQAAAPLFNAVEAVMLTNAEVTRERLEAALDTIARRAAPQDVFVFYYAGHGVMAPGTDGGFFLVPADVTQLYGDDDQLARRGLSSARLQALSQTIPAQKQLFVLDACQSAGALAGLSQRGAAEEKAIAQLARSTGTHWLTASGSQQFATEFSELGHGAFTYTLLQALAGRADTGDGRVTVNELKAYLETTVPELTAKFKGSIQYPASYGFGQDFPVALVGEAGQPGLKN